MGRLDADLAGDGGASPIGKVEIVGGAECGGGRLGGALSPRLPNKKLNLGFEIENVLERLFRLVRTDSGEIGLFDEGTVGVGGGVASDIARDREA